MANRIKLTARILAGSGCTVVLAGAALHRVVAYPRVSAALAASNLGPGMQAAMRAVFLMIEYCWIVIAIVTLIAAFTDTRIRKAIVLFCGLALLVQIPVWVGLMGWFIGNEMFLAAGTLITCGGLLLPAPMPLNPSP